MGTHDEDRESYIKAMGEDLGTAYHYLWNECALLHTRWEEFVLLFGTNQERFEVMNESAPGFFYTVQQTMFESTLMHISRLTDKAKTRDRKNLTLATLVDFGAQMPSVDLQALYENAKIKSTFARDWRNRFLAHTDYEIALEKSPTPLEATSRNHVAQALEAIVNMLSAVEHSYTGSTLGFLGVSPYWGGLEVLKALRKSARVEQNYHERLLSGELSSIELKFDEPI